MCQSRCGSWRVFVVTVGEFLLWQLVCANRSPKFQQAVCGSRCSQARSRRNSSRSKTRSPSIFAAPAFVVIVPAQTSTMHLPSLNAQNCKAPCMPSFTARSANACAFSCSSPVGRSCSAARSFPANTDAARQKTATPAAKFAFACVLLAFHFCRIVSRTSLN